MKHLYGIVGTWRRAGAGATLTTVAIAAALDVKTGLWEVSRRRARRPGMPPIPPQALAQMSPAAARAGDGGDGGSHGTRQSAECHALLHHAQNAGPRLHFDQDHRGILLHANADEQSACIHSMHVWCAPASNRRQATFLHIDAMDRETIRGTFNMVMTDGTNTMTMKRRCKASGSAAIAATSSRRGIGEQTCRTCCRWRRSLARG